MLLRKYAHKKRPFRGVSGECLFAGTAADRSQSVLRRIIGVAAIVREGTAARTAPETAACTAARTRTAARAIPRRSSVGKQFAQKGRERTAAARPARITGVTGTARVAGIAVITSKTHNAKDLCGRISWYHSPLYAKSGAYDNAPPCGICFEITSRIPRCGIRG